MTAQRLRTQRPRTGIALPIITRCQPEPLHDIQLGEQRQGRHGTRRARKNTTAYARFAKLYDDLLTEHCRPDAIRQRKFNRTLEMLLKTAGRTPSARTCGCGNDKMLMPNGTLGEACCDCQEIEDRGHQRRRAERRA